MKIGITLTSSLEVGDEYIRLTKLVAETLAEQGHGIVYGGTDYGMMATLAESYKLAGGVDLIGVMAKDLMKVTKGYKAYKGLDTAFLEKTMEDRKRRIVETADGFIILPGGYGTFEEIGMILGGRVNKLFNKPIAIYNFNGFYDTLLKFLDEMQGKDFSKTSADQFCFVSDDIQAITSYLVSYQPSQLADKFVR